MSDDDDFFASLGGNLMKDLLADLAVSDGDFSLEALEKELSTMDSRMPVMDAPEPPGMSAASMVVAAQDRASAANAIDGPPPGMNLPAGKDAWSVSLEKFTAMSLEEDFLAADTVRKQQQQDAGELLVRELLDTAEEYDVMEKPSVAPPPGMGMAASVEVPSVSGEVKTEESKPPVPPPKPLPKTPTNSVAMQPAVPTVPQEQTKPEPVVSHAPSQPPQMGMPVPMSNIPVAAGVARPVAMPLPMQMPPAFGIPVAPGMVPPPHPGMPPQGYAPIVATPVQSMPPQAMPVPVPVPPPVPVKKQLFCNPHPAAAPIHADAIISKFMTNRDLLFVVHAILKPILALGISDQEYFVQFLQKRFSQQLAPKSKPKKLLDEEEMTKKALLRSKEWTSEQKALGVTPRKNVARPRALIAIQRAQENRAPTSEHKQRAALWKARIVCDQAYQAYHNVAQYWNEDTGGSVPQKAQPYLLKLMKCLGMTMVDSEYLVDPEALQTCFKLTKGRILFARILEKALLPPKAVQAILPVALGELLVYEPPKSGDPSDDRVFSTLARLIQAVNIPGPALLSSVYQVQANARAALITTSRMQCVHSLLQKGTTTFQSPGIPEDLATEWSEAEAEFMKILQTV